MHRTKLSALAGSLLVVTLAACGGGGNSASDVTAKVAAQMTKEGLSNKDAECFAGLLVKDIGVKKLKGVDFSADAPPAGLQDEIASASIKAMTTCKIDAAALSG